MKKIIYNIFFWGLFISLNGLVGFFIGYYSSTSDYSSIDWILLIVATIVFFVLHIIIHEAGHGLFGKLSGYQFVSFRIFSLTWIKETGRQISFKRLKIPGTLGQCLMASPLFEPNTFPFRRYLLGEVIMNLATSFLVGLIGIFLHSPFALIFSFVGLILASINLLPSGFNDGMSLKLACTSEQQRYLLYLQLEINYQLSIGKTYTELPQKYYEILPNTGKPTYFNDWQEFLRLGYLLEKQDFPAYKIQIKHLWERKNTLILPYQTELKKEFLFFLMIDDPNDSRIVELWHDRTIQASLKQALPSNARIRASYDYFIENQPTQDLNILYEARQQPNQAINLGDFKMEMKLSDWLEKLIFSHETTNLADLEELALENCTGL